MKPEIKILKGIEKRQVLTRRLKVNVLESSGGSETVFFIHGNVSSAAFWQETMLALPRKYHSYACDLRGYGDTDPLPVDATLGLEDMADDVIACIDALGLDSFHLAGHSMGGGVAMKVMRKIPKRIASLTLVDSMSPYGFSGSKGDNGTPCHEDGAPAGAGGVNPDFVRLLKEGYMANDEPMAPLNVFRQFYVKPPFIPREEEMYLTSMLSTKVGDDWYPGNSSPSPNWPTLGPGLRGIVNAFSRKYFDVSDVAELDHKPPVLWIRGADDLIVSNNSMFDIAALGAMGAVPGWPGEEVCPSQPMLDQLRAVFLRYGEDGGVFREEVIEDSGHSPFIDQPERFNSLFQHFLVEFSSTE